MAFLPKPNDVLEVIEDRQNGLYKVYSTNDECIYTMKRSDIQHEERLGAEVIWDVGFVPAGFDGYDPTDDEVLNYG